MNKSRLLFVTAAAFALWGCATPPEEDPLYIRMTDLDARVQRIERVLTNQSLLELAQRLDAWQADVRTIRGEVELLQNETQGGKTQSRNLYGDLEKRLAALETLGGVGSSLAPGAAPVPAGPTPLPAPRKREPVYRAPRRAPRLLPAPCPRASFHRSALRP